MRVCEVSVTAMCHRDLHYILVSRYVNSYGAFLASSFRATIIKKMQGKKQ